MISNDEQVKVMDFGLVRVSDASTQLTKTGMVIGTLSYCPPEQAEAKIEEIDEQSDVYAIGATLYELLAGCPPIHGGSILELLYKTIHQEPIRPCEINPQIPPVLQEVCLKALQKTKEKRYPSVAALRDSLRKFSAGRTGKIQRKSVGDRMQNWLYKHKKLASIMAISLCLIVLLGKWGINYMSSENTSLIELYMTEAEVLLQKGKIVEVIEIYQKVKDISPNFPDIHKRLGIAYEQMKNYPQAVYYLERYLELAKDAKDVKEIQEKIRRLRTLSGNK
jgi:serine/threonine protein kinase